MATPPPFVASYDISDSPGSFSWGSSTTPKTVDVTVAAGDILVVLASTSSPSKTVGTPSGGGLTYTLNTSVESVSSRCNVYLWSAPCASSQTFTLSGSRTAGSGAFGFAAFRFGANGGTGAATATNSATGNPSLGITTTQNNSAIVVVTADWNGLDGATRAYPTVNGSAPVERTYQLSLGSYTTYGVYYADAGAAGSKTVGMSAPTGQQWSIAALEVIGTAGGGGGTFAPPPVSPIVRLQPYFG